MKKGQEGKKLVTLENQRQYPTRTQFLYLQNFENPNTNPLFVVTFLQEEHNNIEKKS